MSEIKTPKVQLRGGFSDRNGINRINTEIQLTDLDERTRVCLYNNLNKLIDATNYDHQLNRYKEITKDLYNSILENVYSQILETDDHHLDSQLDLCKKFIKDTILNDDYDAVLTLIEYICNWTHDNIVYRYPIDQVQNGNSYEPVFFDEYEFFNAIFEKECVGYRFVNEKIIKNIDKTEITAIEEASNTKFDGCNTHIQKATHFLYDREKPDYKNSIKESISAVESICKIIAGEGATLGETLKILERKRGLKGQLKSAFEKLYVYTNDKGGIRHADGLFASEVSFEEAKFMLVSCCAFVNYLIAEYGKIEA